jgi:hypothetical protein
MHPADVAHILEALPLDERRTTWEQLECDAAAAVFLEVSDVASFEELDRRIGCPVRYGSDAAYETDEAHRVGLAVRREMAALSGR